MAELDLQKLMAEATQQRSSITTALLAIQKSLDKMQLTVTKREPLLASLEPAVNETPARRPGVETAVDKLQTDIGDIRAHLAKIATRPVPTGSSSTMLHTRCSTECPSHDTLVLTTASVSALTSPAAPTSPTTTNDVVPELAAPVVSNEALVIEASVVTPPTPTRCSTGGLDHTTDRDNSRALCLLPRSMPTLFTMLREASPPLSHRLFVAIELDIKAPTRCSTMCFTDNTIVFTYMFMADVTQSIRRQGQMLRPAPWPSFACSHVYTLLQLEEFRSLTKIASAGIPRQHSVGFLPGDELVLGTPVRPQSIWSWEYLQYELLQPGTPSLQTHIRNEALREEKMLDFMVALMGLKPWLPWNCFSLEANFSTPHVGIAATDDSGYVWWPPDNQPRMMSELQEWLHPTQLQALVELQPWPSWKFPLPVLPVLRYLHDFSTRDATYSASGMAGLGSINLASHLESLLSSSPDSTHAGYFYTTAAVQIPSMQVIVLPDKWEFGRCKSMGMATILSGGYTVQLAVMDMKLQSTEHFGSPLPPAKPPDNHEKCVLILVEIQHRILVSLCFLDMMNSTLALGKCNCQHLISAEACNLLLDKECLKCHTVHREINLKMLQPSGIQCVQPTGYFEVGSAQAYLKLNEVCAAVVYTLDHRTTQDWELLPCFKRPPRAYFGMADSSPVNLCGLVILVEDSVQHWAITCTSIRDGGKPISYEKAKEYFSQDPSQKWAAYVAGIILVLMTELGVRVIDSMSILGSSSIPKGKGASSFASVEVATRCAIAVVYGLNIAPRELARLCQKAENHFVGAPCGVMDQMVCQPAEVRDLVTKETLACKLNGRPGMNFLQVTSNNCKPYCCMLCRLSHVVHILCTQLSVMIPQQ